jgi:hypothetical protein
MIPKRSPSPLRARVEKLPEARIPQPEPDTSRDAWLPFPGSAFREGSGAASLNRVLEMVCAAVRVE